MTSDLQTCQRRLGRLQLWSFWAATKSRPARSSRESASGASTNSRWEELNSVVCVRKERAAAKVWRSVVSVHAAGSVGEARARIQNGGPGTGAAPGSAERRPAALRPHDQAGPVAGQSACSVQRHAEVARGRLHRAQLQIPGTPRKSLTASRRFWLSRSFTSLNNPNARWSSA